MRVELEALLQRVIIRGNTNLDHSGDRAACNPTYYEILVHLSEVAKNLAVAISYLEEREPK